MQNKGRGCLYIHPRVCACPVMSDSVTPWTVARQAPLSVGLSWQGYSSGLPFPSPGPLPDPGIDRKSAVSCLAGGFFTTEPSGIYTFHSGNAGVPGGLSWAGIKRAAPGLSVAMFSVGLPWKQLLSPACDPWLPHRLPARGALGLLGADEGARKEVRVPLDARNDFTDLKEEKSSDGRSS